MGLTLPGRSIPSGNPSRPGQNLAGTIVLTAIRMATEKSNGKSPPLLSRRLSTIATSEKKGQLRVQGQPALPPTL